jgi:hypothetical protein
MMASSEDSMMPWRRAIEGVTICIVWLLHCPVFVSGAQRRAVSTDSRDRPADSVKAPPASRTVELEHTLPRTACQNWAVRQAFVETLAAAHGYLSDFALNVIARAPPNVKQATLERLSIVSGSDRTPRS